jgi:hypothetical protein
VLGVMIDYYYYWCQYAVSVCGSRISSRIIRRISRRISSKTGGRCSNSEIGSTTGFNRYYRYLVILVIWYIYASHANSMLFYKYWRIKVGAYSSITFSKSLGGVCGV